jgi:hypothetical protein
MDRLQESSRPAMLRRPEEPTAVAGFAEWPLHDSCPYDASTELVAGAPDSAASVTERSGTTGRRRSLPAEQPWQPIWPMGLPRRASRLQSDGCN